jgi:hypothetical protein
MAIVGDRIRARLEGGNWQRLHCALIVSVSAASAFLVSRILMGLHVWSMAWRYGIASLAGYGVFLLMIRAWVWWKCSRADAGGDDAPVARVTKRGSGVDVGDLLDGDMSLPSRGGGRAAKAAFDAFQGGRSGGAGASMAFESPPQMPSVTVANVGGGPSTGSGLHGGGGKGGGFSLDIDGDDLFWLIVALVAAFAGIAAVTYVIWVAPSFLGEAAVNAAVAGKVYHGMQRRDTSHWTEDQFKRTIVPAVILCASAIAAGYAFHRLAPEAVSVGGVWQHLAAKYAR